MTRSPHSTEHTVQFAVANNARWCDAVCRAHGQPTLWREAFWFCPTPPPFYPNLVTLRDDAAARAAVQAAVPAAGPFAVKDSFAALDLTPLGLHLLFDATWIVRDPQPTPSTDAGLRWEIVRETHTLAAWEAAWAAAEAPPGRVFPPALLEEPGVRFLAGWRGEQIAAGGILNRSGAGPAQVAGLSNTFAAPGQDAALCWAAAAGQAARLAPGLPVVGYEHGAPLEWARAAGFAPSGQLRVWARDS